jgi:hypothetical protein
MEIPFEMRKFFAVKDVRKLFRTSIPSFSPEKLVPHPKQFLPISTCVFGIMALNYTASSERNEELGNL